MCLPVNGPGGRVQLFEHRRHDGATGWVGRVPTVLRFQPAGEAVRDVCVAIWMEPESVLLHDGDEDAGAAASDAFGTDCARAGEFAAIASGEERRDDALGRRPASCDVGSVVALTRDVAQCHHVGGELCRTFDSDRSDGALTVAIHA